MHGNGLNREPPAGLPDALLWQRSRAIDASEDPADGYLDLAACADGLLDLDDDERVAEWVAHDPIVAADVAAARALAATGGSFAEMPETMIRRATALVVGTEASPGNHVVAFPRRRFSGFQLPGMARWGSLAAAIAVASWLGFTLGMDTSRSFAPVDRSGDESFLHDMLDPSTTFLRDLGADTQS